MSKLIYTHCYAEERSDSFGISMEDQSCNEESVLFTRRHTCTFRWSIQETTD